MTTIAIALAVVSFGLLAAPPAALAVMLGHRARRELARPSPTPTRALTAVAWWASLLAAALSLIAVVVLALDVAGVGDVANRVVERAR